MTTFRAQTIYVTSRTLKRLGLVQRLFPPKNITAPVMTRDELADHMLNEVIAEKYPEIIELEKEIDAAEKNFMAKFREKA